MKPTGQRPRTTGIGRANTLHYGKRNSGSLLSGHMVNHHPPAQFVSSGQTYAPHFFPDGLIKPKPPWQE